MRDEQPLQERQSQFMPDDVREISGQRIVLCARDGPVLSKPQDASDLISLAREHSASAIALPMQRLDPAFFQLRTGLAGEFLQKFVNYRVRLVLLGDLSELAAQSTALRDLIRESNRGSTTWFLADLVELEQRLTV